MNLIKTKKKNHSNFCRLCFFIMPLALLITYSSQLVAQVPKELPAAKVPTVNAGGLLTQFANAIKPTSFIEKWASEKAGWLSTAGKIASAPAMASSISSLAKFIKPSMFKEGFNLQNLLQTATKAKSMTDAAGLLKNLEGGLKPEAMVSGWASKKDSWLNALNLLK